MPLPKPPTKKATLLSDRDFESQAAPKPGKRIAARSPQTSSDSASGPLALYDPQPETAPATRPAAPASPVAAPAVRAAAPVKQPEPKPRKPRNTGPAKLFVLDTNVLMHDPTSLFRFEEHDVFLPMQTLEELDDHKKGLSEVARNARQASRYLDEIVTKEAAGRIATGIPLARHPADTATGRLFLQTEAMNGNLPASLATHKADNKILGVVTALIERLPDREVVLVSKDINMRIKAHALGLAAEDYFNDKVLEDTDVLYTGVRELPADFWDLHGKDMESWKKEGRTYYRIRGPLCQELLLNEFVFQEGDRALHAMVKEVSGKTAVLETVRDYTHAKNAVWGITA